MVESYQYSWPYAETIASNMKKIFSSPTADNKTKVTALELAIYAAWITNRFAAMGTCSSMITSVNDETLGAHVVVVMQKFDGKFVDNIEASQCKSSSVMNYLHSLKQA